MAITIYPKAPTPLGSSTAQHSDETKLIIE